MCSHAKETMEDIAKAYGIPYLPVHIEIPDIRNGALQILRIIRAHWSPHDIKQKDLDESCGEVNRTFACFVNDRFDDAVVFRISQRYADFESLIKKDQVIKSFLILQEVGVSPTVFCLLENGLCCQYVKGQNFTRRNTKEFRNLPISKGVARILAKVHAQKTTDLALNKYRIPSDNTNERVFSMLMDGCWGQKLADDEAQTLFDSPEFPTKDEFKIEKEAMESMVKDLGFRYGFSHNDCHYGNIVHDHEQGKTTVLDYDVCGFNYQGFDLGQYMVTSAIGFLGQNTEKGSISLHTPEFQLEFCRSYLESLSQEDAWGREITEHDVKRLHVQVSKMSLYVIVYLIAVCVLLAARPRKESETEKPKGFILCGLELWSFYKTHKDDLLNLDLPPVEESLAISNRVS